MSELINKPVPPSLSPALRTIYLTLSLEEKQLFNKVFMLMWDYVCPLKSFVNSGGILHSYYVIDLLRSRYNLTTNHLSALTYLYQITRKGADIVHSQLIMNSLFMADAQQLMKYRTLAELRTRFLIKRHYFDPSQPYLSRFRSNNPEFIELLPAGVTIVHDIEKQLYYLLRNTSLNDLTGVNKKGQPNG
jgi:hypothetical protein